MKAVIVNAIAIVIGSIIGLLFGNRLNKRYQEVVMTVVGLCVLYIGIDSVLQTDNMLILIISSIVGTLIGTWLNIEEKLNSLGSLLKKPFKNVKNENFVDGFVTSTLIFAVGAMTIVGSIEAGLLGKYDVLYTKSIIDFITAIVLASSLGLGVIFSSLSVSLFEGCIVLIAIFSSGLFSDVLIANISGVGGILIIALSLKVLNIKEIEVANMLPAVVIPIVFEVVTRFI
ncbi:hypothetical protein SAMN02745245_00581 [Anaerosphaera aminiphila DSM 21120]|uniref:DUF554 domain-containing protein n=1 Tax=Anaerosphaera aminiphila DSM 21120 TaxID=1120995 RepID=A0A1M5QBD2_9FIRM|nr:DUF554 domain-containing protein [Anaerosphaera aminiphila]SHH11230.1 hypothetical protein SAMN02745245_00581 [Anaerosphaera aminiphila DSM 21120]